MQLSAICYRNTRVWLHCARAALEEARTRPEFAQEAYYMGLMSFLRAGEWRARARALRITRRVTAQIEDLGGTMGDQLFHVRVWHSILEVQYQFEIWARTEQRARIGVREFFTKDQLDKRVLRVAALSDTQYREHVTFPPTSTWEPL